MAFIGTETLKKMLESADVIAPFDQNKVINGAYELTLGGQVFQTGQTTKGVKSLAKKEKIQIEPGQFALLLTEEVVRIPKDKIAFISMKASIKFNGLVNVSGFHVDPGFYGKLLFSVYNAGPSTIVLSQGTSYFPIWFASLNETQEYHGSHNGQMDIPDDPVRALSQGELASPNVLSKRIDEVKHLKTKIEWAVLAVITLLIGLNVKVWSDSSNLKEAVQYGYNKKSTEMAIDSTKGEIAAELKMLNDRIDSLMKITSQNAQSKNPRNARP
jgi:dCTP deaminase